MRTQLIVSRLEGFSAHLGARVFRKSLSSSVFGCTDAACIYLRVGLNQEQQLLTLVHELTHILVHCGVQPAINRTVCEYEAETVERLVGTRLGLAAFSLQEHSDTITDDLLACSVRRVTFAADVLLEVASGKGSTANPAGTSPFTGEARHQGQYTVP